MIIIAIPLSISEVHAEETYQVEPSQRMNEVFVTHDGLEIAMDIYLPDTESNSARPVCLYIHGGGWQGGDKAEGEIFLRGPLAAGWIGISTNYRLSGQASWPAQIDDVHACLEWISMHSHELNADTGRIVVAGGSAGGHLALIAGLDQGQWGDYRIIGAFSLYGPTDLLAGEWDFHQIRYMIVNLLGGDPHNLQGLARDASPVNYVDAMDVPVFMVHGDADDLVPIQQSNALLELLQSHGVEARLVTVPGGNHGNFDETTPDWTWIAREFQAWSNQLAGIAEEGQPDEPSVPEDGSGAM